MGTPISFGRRLVAHLSILSLILLGTSWMWADFSSFPALETWSMILGYLSFILIGCTLLVGPLQSWLPAGWMTVSLSIRRDIGIWAGLTGLLHVILVLVLFEGEPRLIILQENRSEKADGWMGLFFFASSDPSMWPSPNWTLTGVANYLGLLAFFILLPLWLTSSARAEKWLGGSSWKRLHLANPWLFVIVLFHGLIYIQSIKGEPHTFSDMLVFAAMIWIVRSISFIRRAFFRKR
ncbi:DMSO/TMAO reductase YedYZ heme-binding membrane subunit [Brevibacillus sp. AG162]|uniref:ferric reductase-like transmembrane domain-containing protein n=1 Tax=Brevibacillus sp. AG162 TaxID=2572910 RepID=UPI00115185C2|nr:ferric reductase-like transmembrane domain-containing protein [Brevibacillus sp. AG162]TQK74359.1 DMSO/TMAO reductase YedYZ heme-binding membrane subunit [Brevibacillus sp. AG162]